jgi:hypothetical protein
MDADKMLIKADGAFFDRLWDRAAYPVNLQRFQRGSTPPEAARVAELAFYHNFRHG